MINVTKNSKSLNINNAKFKIKLLIFFIIGMRICIIFYSKLFSWFGIPAILLQKIFNESGERIWKMNGYVSDMGICMRFNYRK